MAGVAVGRSSCVDAADVTIGAGHAGVGSGQRECGRAVVKNCRTPGNSAVANGACMREALCNVVGIGRINEGLRMARVTVGRSACENATDMATGAGHADMGSGQRKRRRAVVEN